MCSIENCSLENFGDSDKCILHCEKKKTNLSRRCIEFFFKTFSKNVLNQKRHSNSDIEIYKVIFPNKKIHKIWKLLLKKNIYFKECTFYGEIIIKSIDFKSKIYLKNCIFVKGLNLEHCLIDGDITFNNCFFQEKCSFYKTIFNGFLNLENSIFNKKLELKYGVFKNKVNFKNATFKNKVNIPYADFKSINNYLNININIRKNDRETARIIKDSFEQQNNIIEANKFYAIEMQKREDELSKDIKKGKNIFDWLIFKIHGISSNHSQSWITALLCILIVGLISSLYDYSLFTQHNETIDKIALNMNYKYYIFLLGTFIILSVSFFIAAVLKENRAIYVFIFSSLLAIYLYTTHDIKFVLFTNTVNPFAVMTNNDTLDVIQLLFKIIIAFLIYQFIISIRQNTRRK
ncbi:pentapeptide repeat protein [Malaciobacter marinus]|jgi:hypothetical protein|uniref:Pentapeptide repeat protein n=1 Tax=Malaciobacter marinus TaxID=505249 RepID=A0AB36ZUE5_9BACT|nr:pentapeptide repeat-containing protein [Malaciobacter marinus]PPK60452.1 pentapeptide repeat protein [Malaciobacter marinus]SKB61815.1 Pentapeptide repeat-containing protein [Malaciobacter marinus]